MGILWTKITPLGWIIVLLTGFIPVVVVDGNVIVKAGLLMVIGSGICNIVHRLLLRIAEQQTQIDELKRELESRKRD